MPVTISPVAGSFFRMLLLFSFATTRSLALLVTAAFALWQWSLVPAPRRSLFGRSGLLMGVAIILAAIGMVTTLYGVNNSLLYNLFSLFEFLLILSMLTLTMPAWRGLVGVACAAGVLAMLGNAWVDNPVDFLLTEGILLMALILSVLLLAVLWRLAETSDDPLPRVPEFWLYMGFLLYYGGLIPVIGMSRYLYAENPALANRLYVIMPVLCILRYVLTALSCRKEAQRILRDLNG